MTRVVLAASVAGCADLTNVNVPDIVQPQSVASAAGADVLRAGVLTRFTDAYSTAVRELGMLSDELFSTASGGVPADRRALPDNGFGSSYPYAALHAVRINGRRAIAAYQSYAPTQRVRIGQLFAINGYVELFFAEDVCSGVPLGDFTGDEPDFGTPLTTSQMFERAAADFDSALVYASTDARIGNLARIGRARALLGLARDAEAAALVAAVPTTFLYQTEHSASVQPNALYSTWSSSRQFTVADGEGSNGLNFRSANDPRVPVSNIGKGADGITDTFIFTKYGTTVAALITLASGNEARLIEAEVLLRSGQAQAALDKLNALRATTPGLTPLALQATTPAQVDQLFRERAFWLFLSGSRLGDLRRLMRQYGRSAESVFPTGAYRNGLTYSADVHFPAVEGNNPNFSGCIDRTS